MTPLPPPLGGGELVAWRLDTLAFSSTWNSGEGAYRSGGRWSKRGTRAVYCALDPATAILEVAVNKGFDVLDTVPHVLTAIEISDPTLGYVVAAEHVPNPNWLRPGMHSAGQRDYGDKLLAQHRFILIPSVVSTHSWNLIFARSQDELFYNIRSQERFALDTRLNAIGN